MNYTIIYRDEFTDIAYARITCAESELDATLKQDSRFSSQGRSGNHVWFIFEGHPREQGEDQNQYTVHRANPELGGGSICGINDFDPILLTSQPTKVTCTFCRERKNHITGRRVRSVRPRASHE